MAASNHDDLASILDAARAEVAAGRDPDEQALEARIRKAGGGAKALKQLQRVLTVQRARARLAAPPTPPPPAPAPVPVRPRARRRVPRAADDHGEHGGAPLAHRGRRAARLGYRSRRDGLGSALQRARGRTVGVRRQRDADPAGNATSVELALGELPRRVHVLGRANDGRLVRRAIVSALTEDNWNDRWQRRASAS